ncbi:hypothetical protein QM012_006496 [Aureobasidium pullulans]|uniref:Leucine rich repeat protein n=1 Tax=Aureobasidium pullulans TaxID=5580 RepID=A0ABR0TPR0_AURPU
MVKSNKFDYTGRTSSGPKLGKSIASDLEKRADKKQREANKPSSSAPRLSLRLPASAKRTPNKDRLKIKDRERDESESDAKDSTLHKIDLKVPSKSLTDEGFTLLADGLQNALTTCRDLALVDLNLTNNGLTTRSLARLASLIQASCYTLQTLDLSQNKFQVSTDAQTEEWQLFLQSFRSCMTLRRLDLGDNPDLGYRAFEILARVYSREPAVDPEPATGNQSFITLPDSCSVLSNGSLDGTQVRNGNGSDLPTCANGKTLADPWMLKHRRGLRSIPYLTLTNVGLDDTGALFLSYILEQHYYPIQLVTENNASEATSSIRTYRQDANTKGIDWDNNSEFLSKDGLHLLQCAEKLRMRMLLGDSDSVTSSYMSAGIADAPDASPVMTPGVGLRRSSLFSVQSSDYSMFDKSDINSARKKIQRNTIGHAGCENVDLWSASLSAIIVSRKVFLLAPVFEMFNASHMIVKADEQNADANQNKNAHAVQDVDDQATDMLVTEGHLEQSLSTLSLRPGSINFEDNQIKRSYASTLVTSSPVDSMSPELVTPDEDAVSAVQSNTKILRTSASSRGYTKVKNGSDGNQVLERQLKPSVSSKEYMRFQMNRMEKLKAYHKGESDGYRDVSLRCHLPLSICLEILRLSMSPVDLSHLGLDKQRKAFNWGQKRETLKSGYEWRMKDESSQLLMLLSGAGCVEY